MFNLLSPSNAEHELRRLIAEHGQITFAQFMDVALYWPRGGYYSTRRAFGIGGDYYTAPLTHPAFGALVTQQLLTMWHLLGKPTPFSIIEVGAGDARLAIDVMEYAPILDVGFGRAMDYVGIDRHAPPADFSGDWVDTGTLPQSDRPGVVVANELVDAMPVHRVTIVDGELHEIYVGIGADGRFEERIGLPSSPELESQLMSLGVHLSEGFRTEVNLSAGEWCKRAYTAIGRGYLLLIDYGHEAVDYYHEDRRRGTLRCYSGHALSMNPYVNVGRQDISVHVEVTSLRRAALEAGFVDAGMTTQADLLAALGMGAYRSEVESRADVSPSVRSANIRLMDSLIDPGGMGGFKVLAFSKDSPCEEVLGVAVGDPWPAPMATPSHMPLNVAGVERRDWPDGGFLLHSI